MDFEKQIENLKHNNERRQRIQKERENNLIDLIDQQNFNKVHENLQNYLSYIASNSEKYKKRILRITETGNYKLFLFVVKMTSRDDGSSFRFPWTKRHREIKLEYSPKYCREHYSNSIDFIKECVQKVIADSQDQINRTLAHLDYYKIKMDVHTPKYLQQVEIRLIWD